MKSKPSKQYIEPAHAHWIGVAPPGTLLCLKNRDPDEAHYKLGTLWVWSHADNVHYLVQTTHRKHCHRVHAVFWTAAIANVVRKLIEDGMRPGDLAVYTMLRESGIAPLTQFRQPRKSR